MYVDLTSSRPQFIVSYQLLYQQTMRPPGSKVSNTIICISS